MEPITHLLTGACLSRAGLGQRSRLAGLTLVLAAVFPDIDVVAYAKNPVYGFAHHRGITHSIAAVPINAIVVLSLVYLYFRYSKSELTPTTVEPSPEPHWKTLFLYACLSGCTHILLDFTNLYGIRPFEPFSYKWYSWDIVFVVEPLFLIVLLIGLLCPYVLTLVCPGTSQQSRAGRYRKIAAASSLTCVALLCFLRHIQHQRAVDILLSAVGSGTGPVGVSASPYWINPFHWQGVVKTNDLYQIVQLNSLTGRISSRHSNFCRMAADIPAVQAGLSSALGRAYLDWAQVPFIKLEERPGHVREFTVWLYEMRFYYPEMRRKMLGASVDIAANLEVVGQHFSSGSAEKIVNQEALNCAEGTKSISSVP